MGRCALNGACNYIKTYDPVPLIHTSKRNRYQVYFRWASINSTDPFNIIIIIIIVALDWQVNSMIRMVSGECGGAVNHKLSLTAGCSVSSTNTTSTHLKAFRYVVPNSAYWIGKEEWV